MKIESDENSHRKKRVESKVKEEAEKSESGNNEKKFQRVTRVEMRKNVIQSCHTP